MWFKIVDVFLSYSVFAFVFHRSSETSAPVWKERSVKSNITKTFYPKPVITSSPRFQHSQRPASALHPLPKTHRLQAVSWCLPLSVVSGGCGWNRLCLLYCPQHHEQGNPGCDKHIKEMQYSDFEWHWFSVSEVKGVKMIKMNIEHEHSLALYIDLQSFYFQQLPLSHSHTCDLHSTTHFYLLTVESAYRCLFNYKLVKNGPLESSFLSSCHLILTNCFFSPSFPCCNIVQTVFQQQTAF